MGRARPSFVFLPTRRWTSHGETTVVGERAHTIGCPPGTMSTYQRIYIHVHEMTVRNHALLRVRSTYRPHWTPFSRRLHTMLFILRNSVVLAHCPGPVRRALVLFLFNLEVPVLVFIVVRVFDIQGGTKIVEC